MMQILVRNWHLLLLATPFLLLPSRDQVRGLVTELAAQQQHPVVQWIAIIFFASIPLLIIARPSFQLIKLEMNQDERNRENILPRLIVALFLLSSIVYTFIRVLYWIS